MGLRNYRGLGAAADVAVLQPFLDPDFVEAFTATTPVLGPSGRNESMRRLFADLLPDRILTRTSKATFNSSAFGPGARDFVARWTGGGVDPALVDAAFLREAWSSPTPPAGTFLLLQQAWLRTEGLTG